MHKPDDKICFYDTETTGFTKPHGDVEDQPHMVQLGMVITDGKGEVLATYETIIKPEGWFVPPGAANVHGISTERAEEEGIPLAEAIAEFDKLVSGCTHYVAHNISFDRVVVAASRTRAGAKAEGTRHPHLRDPISGTPIERCTMRAATDIVRIPKVRGGFKWPKLQETHLYLFNENFEDAHSAMADCLAMKRVYFELVERGAFEGDDADANS